MVELTLIALGLLTCALFWLYMKVIGEISRLEQEAERDLRLLRHIEQKVETLGKTSAMLNECLYEIIKRIKTEDIISSPKQKDKP